MRPLVILLLLLLLHPRPALAVREWYDHYLKARDTDIAAEDWKGCVESLNAALRLRPRAGVNVQTYGLQFVDYLPYYYLGLCQRNLGDDAASRTNFTKVLTNYRDFPEWVRKAQTELGR